MDQKPFTSRTLLGESKEPTLVKALMKTSLFKTPRQAGKTLVVISALCWVGIAAFATSFIQENNIVKRPAPPLSDLRTASNDPVLIEALLGEETISSGEQSEELI